LDLNSSLKKALKDKSFSSKNTLNIRGKVFDISRPKVMGIINVTSDSFYSLSRKQGTAEIIETAGKMLNDGADFLDIGGYSSRPGAEDITIKEEIDRVVPAIEAIMEQFPESRISIDTFRSTVAEKALDSGASIVNDISGGNLDQDMDDLVAERKVPYIIMHMKGTPKIMQSLSKYENVLTEVMDFFQERVLKLHNLGLTDIIIDPGFGFSKTVEQNYVLLKNLDYFKALELPILAGISRKSMIYKPLGLRPEEALNGTTVLNTIALEKGAGILRVHDVKEAVEVVELFDKIYY
jgi:dihydropteroate synthase